jgi:prepilin-type N-terminal cleavage/methylation domain-containing protein
MTLIEVMVVMIIMALVSAGAGIVVLQAWRDAQLRQALTDAHAVRQATIGYLLELDGCPSVAELVRAKKLSSAGRTTDPWGHEFVIDCDGDEPSVRSPGPDGQLETEDDVR